MTALVRFPVNEFRPRLRRWRLRSSRIRLESELLESGDPHGLAPWVNEIGRLSN